MVEDSKKIFVGLGNKGKEYDNTVHNIGFIFIDRLAEFLKLNFKNKFSAQLASNNSFILVKPQTYMNNSGKSVAAVMNFYKISRENVFVFYDDADLPYGKLKVKIGGGAGGHNGIKSLDNCIGKDYTRIRIGASNDKRAIMDLSSYVLSKINTDDMITIDIIMGKIIDNLSYVTEKKFDTFISNVLV